MPSARAVLSELKAKLQESETSVAQSLIAAFFSHEFCVVGIGKQCNPERAYDISRDSTLMDGIDEEVRERKLRIAAIIVWRNGLAIRCSAAVYKIKNLKREQHQGLQISKSIGCTARAIQRWK